MSELQKRAMLIELNIRSWSARNTDREATSRVAREHNADIDAVSVSKRLVAKRYTAEIASISQEIRFAHYNLTLRWDDQGMRLLPIELVDQYKAEIDALIDKRITAIGKFVEAYREALEDAMRGLGDLFRPEDYPSAAKLAGKFDCSYRFTPVPSGAHFIADVGDEERERIRADIEANVTARLTAAVGGIYERLQEAVSGVAERLTPREDGKMPRLHATLFGSLKNLVETARKMNITDDPALAKLIDEIRLSLAGVNIEQLQPAKANKKFDAKTRDRVRGDLKVMSEKLAGFMPPAAEAE